MPFALVIVALILLVVVHELGHFLAARAVGIRATKFYVFFPPALFKRQVGDVEYGIGAIPAGGFVKLPGMFEPQPGEVAERLRHDYADVMPLVTDGDVRLRLDAARRALAHADGTDAMTAPLVEIRDGLTDVHATLEQEDERKLVGRTLERVRGLLDDVHPRAYWRARLWRRMAVIFAGPLVNLVLAFVVLVGFHWALTPRYEVTHPLVVAEVEDGSPADRAGLEDGARLTGWNGPVVGAKARELFERLSTRDGRPVELAWRDKSGEEHEASVRPERLGGEEQKRIGLQWSSSADAFRVKSDGYEEVSFGRGVDTALADVREITWGNLSRLPRVFFDSEVREDVGSVVGIVQVADEVDQSRQMVRYVAIISLILAIMNLLPLLPLDGGHLLFGILEAVRRKPMPRAAFERYSMVGMALVLMLFFIGLDNDITRARG